MATDLVQAVWQAPCTWASDEALQSHCADSLRVLVSVGPETCAFSFCLKKKNVNTCLPEMSTILLQLPTEPLLKTSFPTDAGCWCMVLM